MRRPMIATLAAVDASVVALATLATVFAPLTVAWVLNDMRFSLWSTTSAVWAFGFGAPIDVAIAADAIPHLGIDPSMATFVVSLTPVVFAIAVAWFAYGSGARAARAGSALSGIAAGTATFALLTALIVLPARNDILSAERLWALLIPPLVYLLASAAGGAVASWRAGRGIVHDLTVKQRTITEVIGVGVLAASAGLIGVGAIALTVRFALGGAQALAIYQGLQVDVAGATALTLGQLAYLPTAVVWAVSWLAGPGFAMGTDAVANPVVTTPTVLPPIPMFALVPQHSSVWWLAIVLVPILVGALAGWLVRGRLEVAGNAALSANAPVRLHIGHRALVALLITVLTAGVWALFAVATSGSIGPGVLTHLGPDPLLLAAALAAEIGVGSAIMLLAPVRHKAQGDEEADVATSALISTELDENPASAVTKLDGVLKLVVLISGGGSNLRALLDEIAAGTIAAEVVAVGADRDAEGLEHAAEFGIERFVVPFGEFENRDAWGEALGDKLAEYTPDLVVLSGLMRLLPAGLVGRFAPNIINTHPAYLPEFPGAHGVRDALAAGVEQTGASVIVVDNGVDTGAILAQERVSVEPDDTEQTLHDRIKPVERRLLAEVIRGVAGGTIDLENRQT